MTLLRANRFGAVLVPAAGILAYLNAFAATFQFDDRRVVLEDGRLRSVATFLDAVPGMIRPLLKLTFLVDRRLFGLDPAGYHALNLLLHCGSALLVLGILSAAVRRVSAGAITGSSPAAGTGNGPASRRWLPLCAALLFAVHPLATETVTYISGRATGLASFLALLSVYLGHSGHGLGFEHARSFSRARPAPLRPSLSRCCRRKPRSWLPALLLLVHLVVGTPGRENARRVVALQAVLWAVGMAFAAAAAWHPRYATLIRASFDTRPVWQNLVTEANAACYALSLFVVPSRLNFDHDLPVITSALQWPMPLVLAILAGLAAMALLGARRLPLVSLGLGWFFVCLLPAHSVIPRYDILSERNLYLPSVGISIAVTASLGILVGRARRVGAGLRAAAAAALAPSPGWEERPSSATASTGTKSRCGRTPRASHRGSRGHTRTSATP